MIIKAKFGKNHKASPAFFKLYKSIGDHCFSEKEIKEFFKKVTKAELIAQIKSGFFKTLSNRSDHLSRN